MTCDVFEMNCTLVGIHKMTQLSGGEKYLSEIKFLSILIGKWPFQPKREKYLFTFIILTLTLTELVGEFTAIILFYDDRELILESISPLIVTLISYAKYFSHVFNRKKVIYVFKQMEESWRFHSTPSERKVLTEYSDMGKMYTWAVIVGIMIVLCLFIGEPLFPRIYNFILSKNETIPKKYPVPVYWLGINMDENYWYTLSYSSTCIAVIIVVEMTLDTTFIVMTQHAVALFAVTGHILENIPTKEDYREIQKQKNDLSLNDLRLQHYIKCIRSHQRAIDFAKCLEDINVWAFGLTIAFHIPIISVTATQITTQAQNIQETLKYSTFAIIQVFHCFALCLFSHQLITYSTMVQKSVVSGLWYECGPKIQRLLPLVIMRSQRECQITAGKMLAISMETFTVTVKTAASYFTVLAQARNS